jgi:hypothetical protein
MEVQVLQNLRNEVERYWAKPVPRLGCRGVG